MIFEISNILGIKKANIKLNGLTVIAGENDSGKSTIGKSLFCLIKNIAMSRGGFYYKNREKFVISRLEELKNITKFLVKNKKEYEELAKEINKFINFFNTIKNNLDKNKESYLSNLQDLKDSFLKNNLTNITIVFSELEKAVSESFRDQFKQNNMKKLLELMFDRDFLRHYENKAYIKLEDEIIGKKNEAIIQNESRIKIYENGKIFFDVTFIDTPVILQLYPLLKDPDVFSKEYSPTIQDIVRKLLNEPKINLWNKEIIDTLYKKISTIIDIKIEMKEGNIQGLKEDDNYPIKLENLATGIKSFSLLLLLIQKGFVAKNTLLVLDEPEVHLHPKWQLEYARIIVELVKNGITLLVTTHSPYMVEMLEILSRKEKINYNFYLPQKKDGIEFLDVSDDLQPIYQLLSEPYEVIDEEARSFREIMEIEDD